MHGEQAHLQQGASLASLARRRPDSPAVQHLEVCPSYLLAPVNVLMFLLTDWCSRARGHSLGESTIPWVTLCSPACNAVLVARPEALLPVPCCTHTLAGQLVLMPACVLQIVQASTIALCWRTSSVGDAGQALIRRQAEAQASAPHSLPSAQHILVRTWAALSAMYACLPAYLPACEHQLLPWHAAFCNLLALHIKHQSDTQASTPHGLPSAQQVVMQPWLRCAVDPVCQTCMLACVPASINCYPGMQRSSTCYGAACIICRSSS